MTRVALLLLVLILTAGPAPGQDGFDYARFRRRAEQLWTTKDRAGFDALVEGHREHLHRYFVGTEIDRLLGGDRARVAAGIGARLARLARERFHVRFYDERNRALAAAGPRTRERLLLAWKGHPPPGDPVLAALAAVEQARRALDRVPPGPLPVRMRQRIRRLDEAGCPDGALDGLVSVGTWHLLKGEFLASERAFAAAARLDRRIRGGRAAEIALHQGQLALKREDFVAARDRFAAALEIAGGARKVMVRAHLAQAYACLLDLDRAEAEARGVDRELAALPSAAPPLVEILLAEVDMRLGRFERALERNRRAERTIVRAEGERSRRRLLARRQRGYIHLVMGRFARAEAELKQGLAEAERLHDRFETIYHLRYLSELAFREGREGETLNWGVRMLQEARKAGADKEVTLALRFLGKVHLRWGVLEDAALYLREGLEVASRVGIPRWRREIVRDLLQVMDRQGRAGEAKHYESLLRRHLDRGPDVVVTGDLLFLARLARIRGEDARAAGDLERALEHLDRMAEASGDPAVEWLRGAAAIEAAEQSADVEEAFDDLDEAIAHARRIKDPILEAGAITRMAARLSAVGRLAEAKAALERAWALGSQGLQYTGHLPLRAGFFEQSRDVMGKLAAVTLELERKGEEPDDASSLLRLAETQRDRRFRTEWAAYGSSASSARIRNLKGRLEEVLKLFETSDRMEPAGRRTLYRRLIAFREEYYRLTNEAWQERPRIDPERLDVGELRTRLGSALLLEFLVCKEAAFLIAAGKEDGVKLFPLACRAATLEGRVSYLDTFVQRLRIGHERAYARHTFKLYRDLLGPVVAAGLLPPGRPVVVVPDRALERLPFHALVTRPPPPRGPLRFRDLAYLVQRNPVRYLTAASDLLAPGRPRRKPRFLGIAPDEKLTRLHGAVAEVEALAKLFPRGDAATAIGEEAVEERFVARPDLETFTILHFATHGRASALSYSYSGLLLGTRDEKKSDGVLHGFEVKSRGIAAPLVVLSACSSGRDYADPGITGVGWGRVFLEAGAGAVVLSVWRVDDRIAGEFMSAFYRHLLAGEPADLALAAAGRALVERSGGKYAANPRYWAPFILVGGAIRFEAGRHEGG